MFAMAVGQIIIKFFPFILKISNEEEKKEKEIKKRKYLHYIILCLILLLKQFVRLCGILVNKYLLGLDIPFPGSNLFIIQDFTFLSIEMAFMAIFSRFLLKYKFFKHHIISIIIFIVIGIICDFIIRFSYFKEEISSNKLYIVINIIEVINTLVDALYFCYQKYMMEYLYYPYWNIAFIPGKFIFVIAIGLLIFALANSEKENSNIKFVMNFYLYYRFSNGWAIFGKVNIILVIHIILCPLTIIGLIIN